MDNLILGFSNGTRYDETGGWWIPDPDNPEEVRILIRQLEARSNEHVARTYSEINGFDAQLWRESLASGDEELITLAHPSNWMVEEEVEAPGVLDAVLREVSLG